jgi:hypothetical protein
MGITIHFGFMAIDKNTIIKLLAEIKGIAEKCGMKIIKSEEMMLNIHPHPKCENLMLDFVKWKDVKSRNGFDYCKETMTDFQKVLSDENYVCSDFTKTQYAGIKTHILVAELLRKVAQRCTLAYVYDEAGYYETKDIGKTAMNFEASSEMIRNLGKQLKEMYGADKVITAEDL